MALNADTLLDRIHLKNQAQRWRLVALVVALLAILFIAKDYGNFGSGFVGEDHIARFTVDGVILDDPKRTKFLKKLSKDESIKALILRIDSPGGSTVGAEELYLNIKDIAEDVPVVCTMRSFAASGGYLAALGCDHVLARQGTITGSIGVILQTAEISDLAEKLGIKPITVRSGELKGAPTPFNEFTEKEQELLEGVVDSFYTYFIGLVKEERDLTDEQVATIKDGRIFSAKQALEINLIDAIGGEQEALEWLAEERGIDITSLDVKEREMPSDKKGLERLLEDYATAIIPQGLLVRLDGLVSIWQPTSSLATN